LPISVFASAARLLGWRTLPSADFARYSISASNDGSTQMLRCAIFLL
jgi:hypothetical protein